MANLMITVVNDGQRFWLGGTVWRFRKERADTYCSKPQADIALAKARQFMKPAVFNAAKIIPEPDAMCDDRCAAQQGFPCNCAMAALKRNA